MKLIPCFNIPINQINLQLWWWSPLNLVFGSVLAIHSVNSLTFLPTADPGHKLNIFKFTGKNIFDIWSMSFKESLMFCSFTNFVNEEKSCRCKLSVKTRFKFANHILHANLWSVWVPPVFLFQFLPLKLIKFDLSPTLKGTP